MSSVYDLAFKAKVDVENRADDSILNTQSFVNDDLKLQNCFPPIIDANDMVPHVLASGNVGFFPMMDQYYWPAYITGLQSPVLAAATTFDRQPGYKATFNPAVQAVYLTGSQEPQNLFRLPTQDYVLSAEQSSVNHGGFVSSPAAPYVRQSTATQSADVGSALPSDSAPTASVPASAIDWQQLPALTSPARVKSRFHCDFHECFKSFTEKKDLRRHKESCHAREGDPLYQCRCGRQGVRKDNYVRHVKKCDILSPDRVYLCKCSHFCSEKDDHLDHIYACKHGFGPRGRPSEPQSAL